MRLTQPCSHLTTVGEGRKNRNWRLGFDLTVGLEWRRHLERHRRQPPCEIEAAVVLRPVDRSARACLGPDGSTARRWVWRSGLLRRERRCRSRCRRWLRLLQRGDRRTKIRDAFLHIEAPAHEIVDLGGRGLDRRDRRGVSGQGGVEPVEECLDGGIHGVQVRTCLPQATRLDELRQGDVGRGVEWSLIPDVRYQVTMDRSILLSEVVAYTDRDYCNGVLEEGKTKEEDN